MRLINSNDNVIPFDEPESNIEHVDSTTIVERVELTPELKAEFEAAGYTIEVGPVKE